VTLISDRTYTAIANIKAKLRDDTLTVVTMTKTKSSDDIFGVANTLTSGSVSVNAQFFWEDNLLNKYGQGGRVEAGKAIAVIGYDDRGKVEGDNIIIRKDGVDLRINRKQVFPKEKEVLLNLEKIV